MTARPLIFISAVSKELRSARQLVANTLTFLGYQPVWQDIFGTETGDLREMLRKQIDQCKGVVQLVGQCYGAEPPTIEEEFGRVSYTQYEALYARKRQKKTWYLFIDESFPIDEHKPEPSELGELQAAYRRKLQSDTHVYHSLTTAEGLEASVLKLRDDLTRLRRGVKQWAVAIVGLLLLIVGLVTWQLRSQSQLKGEMAKLRQGIMEYAQKDAQVRGSQTETDPAAVQERIYAELGKQLGVDPKVLREKLPRLANEMKNAPNASAYERANASFVAKDYAEAERLALQAAEEARKAQPANSHDVIQALTLAGLSAHRGIQYARAMEHFREAEKLTNRDQNPGEWAGLQQRIADLLVAEGRFSDAEPLFRNVIEIRARVLGPEDPDTLNSLHSLIHALNRQSKYAEAATEARQVIKLCEKAFGPEHPDTIASRLNLADALADQGKNADAEALYREVIRLQEKVTGPEHPRTIAARMGLASALDKQGKNAEAQSLYGEVIKLDEKVFGPQHPRTLNDRMALATALQAGGNYSAAEAEYRRVIKLEEEKIGAEHPDTLTARNNLAEALDDAGKYAEAEIECRQIVALEEKALGPQHLVTLNSRGNLAVALIGQGKFTDAASECDAVLSLMEQSLGPEHPDTLAYTTKFVTGLARQNKAAEAKELATRAEERARKVLGPDNPTTQKYVKLVQDLEAPPNK